MEYFLTKFDLPNLLLLLFAFMFFILFLLVAIVSLNKNEKRAAKRSVLLAILFPILFIIIGLYSNEYTAWIFIGIIIISKITILLPTDFKRGIEFNKPINTIDERDIMFSRRELEKGSERFRDYYKKYPDKKILDDKFRAAPGLLKEGSSQYDPFMFRSAEATFNTVEVLKQKVDGEVTSVKYQADPQSLTSYIKSWAKYLGAADVGVTELKDYHIYTHIGRGDNYGDEVKLDHKYAIVFTVEMNHDMVSRAPEGPIVMESAKEYLISGSVAVQVADFIRQLGYPARAHIDGNYHVVCPLVAKDAGLGEIGRMGLLMTPKLGPRVRISVVTTDLVLSVDETTNDTSVIDFCEKCKKCADACPSRAIPTGPRITPEVDHWQINSEACFTFWCIVGTDCGRCMAVCPYSHESNLMHNFVRWGIRRSYLFRQIAIKFDNILYGKKPPVKKTRGWINYD